MTSLVLEHGQALAEAPARTSTSSTTAEGTRRPLLDMVRLTVATGVIVIHTIESSALQKFTALGTFSTPFFAAAAMLFLFNGIRREPDREWSTYVGIRFRRLYIPFLTWGVIYLVLRNLKHLVLTGTTPVPFNSSFFWTGTAHHLWFLPFLLVAGALFFPLAHWTARNRRAAWIAASVAITCGIIVVSLPGFAYPGKDEHDNWAATRYLLCRCWDRLPALLWGVGIGCLIQMYGTSRIFRSWMAALGLCVAIGTMSWAVIETNSRQLQNFGGMGWLFFGMAPLQLKPSPLLKRLGHISFGVYLSHIVFVEGFQAIFHSVWPGYYWWFDLSNIATTLVGAILLTMLIDRFRYTRWLIP